MENKVQQIIEKNISSKSLDVEAQVEEERTNIDFVNLSAKSNLNPIEVKT